MSSILLKQILFTIWRPFPLLSFIIPFFYLPFFLPFTLSSYLSTNPSNLPSSTFPILSGRPVIIEMTALFREKELHSRVIRATNWKPQTSLLTLPPLSLLTLLPPSLFTLLPPSLLSYPFLSQKYYTFISWRMHFPPKQ